MVGNCEWLENRARHEARGASNASGGFLTEFPRKACQNDPLVDTIGFATFLSSSVVERSAVNRLVAGSNPAWGVETHYKDRS